MKIALLHYAAHPIVGGVETVIRKHSLMMAGAGHHVLVIAGRGEGTDPGVEFSQLDLLDSKATRVLDVKRQLDDGVVPGDFEALASTIQDQVLKVVDGFDWLVAHNVCSLHKNLPLAAAVRRISETRAVPRVVLWHHDLAWTAPRYAAELHDGYPWDLLRTDWPHAVQVTVSESRRRELARLLGAAEKRIRVVPNGVDAAAFLRLGAEAEHLTALFGLLDAAPLILLPARITRRKNIEMALRVLAALRDQHPQARLLVTGPAGPHNPDNAVYLDSLLELRSDLGLGTAAIFVTVDAGVRLSAESVADLYRLADALLLPSVEEGFGIPLLEAALSGVPVFCSDIAPLREVAGTQATYFAPTDEPGSVARRISMALTASRTYGLRKRVVHAYGWQRIYAEHIVPLLGEP